ncbi:AAA family ATPase [Marinilabilia salmonicolor]|uniref:AAA family ATPase n=1 Tax=Marinilabilia salmonicolor TaxID=989 RepID=UPI00029B08DF|nr:ATP-binding protein [Marinilabilia salmonicolor]
MTAIVITGPESTGKSALTKELAEHFQGHAVEEYARQHVENTGGSYSFADVEKIAHYQVLEYHKMDSVVKAEEFVFFDTFLIITKVWFQEVFSCCPVWIDKAIKELKPDLALLCIPDLPWEDDGIRENPDSREYLFDCYLKELEYYQISFSLVEGSGVHRLNSALNGLSARGFSVHPIP